MEEPNRGRLGLLREERREDLVREAVSWERKMWEDGHLGRGRSGRRRSEQKQIRADEMRTALHTGQLRGENIPGGRFSRKAHFQEGTIPGGDSSRRGQF